MNALLLAIALAASSTPAPSVQVAKETIIVVPARKKLVCGAPRPLANDAHQTVRLCEYK